jgi:hypothetical protein
LVVVTITPKPHVSLEGSLFVLVVHLSPSFGGLQNTLGKGHEKEVMGIGNGVAVDTIHNLFEEFVEVLAERFGDKAKYRDPGVEDLLQRW